MHCSLHFRGISLCACAERFSTIASAHPSGRESRGAQLRRDDDRLGQLRLRRSFAVSQRAGPGASVFRNSGVDPVLGSVAISWRMHFRARAACALLKRWFFPPEADSGA